MVMPGIHAISTSTDISVIIVNWNARALLVRCLTSVLENLAELNGDIWVVDNASTDNSVALLRSSFPQVHLIANQDNRGFAAANNQAAMQATGRYLLLLNPDTEVPANTLAPLIAYMDSNTDIGVLGPKLVNPDGTLQRSCWRHDPDLTMALLDALYLWKLPWLPLVNTHEYQPNELVQARDVAHLLGACMLIRHDAWQEVGLLDEHFFLFLEETDWCLRARQAGWRIVYYPDLAVVHHGQHSMRQQPVRNLPHFYRSYCHFYRKHHTSNLIGLPLLKLFMAISVVLRICLWLLRYLQARDHILQTQAQNTLKGYVRVLSELPSF